MEFDPTTLTIFIDGPPEPGSTRATKQALEEVEFVHFPDGSRGIALTLSQAEALGLT